MEEPKDDQQSRLLALKQPVWIGYARAVAVRRQMEELLAHPQMHRMPNMALIGESFNGKTMLFNNFNRRHDPTLAPDYSVKNDVIEKPVFMFQAPPEPDEGRLYRQMLTKLWAPPAARDSSERMLDTLLSLLQSLKTKMLLIDEFGFFQAGTGSKQRKVLNALKFLGNALQIPMVVAGVPETLNLLQSDTQIANRFEPVFLPKWKMGEEYLKLLSTLEVTLRLKSPSNLSKEATAQRILDETDGIIGHITELLQKLAAQAILSGKEHIPSTALDTKNLRQLGWIPPNQRHRFPR